MSFFTHKLIIIIIIIIIIAFKGAVWDFLQSPHCIANRLQHIRSSGLGAVVCKSRGTHQALIAAWHKGTTQLLSLTEFKSHLFELFFIGWTINWWRRGGDRSTRRKPLATSFRNCHILKHEDSSPKQDSNPHNSIGCRRTNHYTTVFMYSFSLHHFCPFIIHLRVI